VTRKYYFSNRDLLIIAVLSGLGGVMSTYIGYLGNLLNRLLGVPFGAGQFVSGLHVFWFILVAGLIRKPGAATAAGALKGFVELFSGSTHGVAIVLVSLVQGLVVDIVLLMARGHNLASYMLAGGISAASNVFVFQTLYFSGISLSYILFIAIISFISGILMAGSLGSSVLDIVQEVRPFRIAGAFDEKTAGNTSQEKTGIPRFRIAFTVLFIALLSFGAVYYYIAVFKPPWEGPICRVEGAVENPLTFQLSDFKEYETTITAELRGQVTYVPPREYTGIPLKAILRKASPRQGAERLIVTAADGYTVEFDIADVLKDENLVLIQEGDMLRLIAGNYSGGYWVKQVTRMIVD